MTGVRYRLRQCFSYAYDGVAYDLVHRLVVVPPRQHGDQHLLLGAVSVSDADACVAWHDDVDGNRVAVVRLARVPQVLELTVDVLVERHGAARVLPAALLRSPRLRSGSALTRADARLRRLATPDPERACDLVHEAMSYAHDVTHVGTTAAQALALGAGVCQDAAHVMLALLRAAGTPCRYVSGHLVGQGGTHAWVEVLEPAPGGARAVAWDPCHGRRADERYVTVAVGRDYRDVPPTSGWYAGQATGRLRTDRSLARLGA